MITIPITPRTGDGRLGPADTPVPIVQREWEFERVLDLYRAREPGRVLELGTYHGGTLYHWLQNAVPGTVVVSIEAYEPDWAPDVAPDFDNRGLYDSWCAKGVTCIAIEGRTTEPRILAEAEEHGPYDWVFIDADHHYDAVLADFEAYRPMVAEGGVMLFHDILPSPLDHIEVAEVWQGIRRAGYLTQEVVFDPEEFGIGVVYL